MVLAPSSLICIPRPGTVNPFEARSHQGKRTGDASTRHKNSLHSPREHEQIKRMTWNRNWRTLISQLFDELGLFYLNSHTRLWLISLCCRGNKKKSEQSSKHRPYLIVNRNSALIIIYCVWIIRRKWHVRAYSTRWMGIMDNQ